MNRADFQQLAEDRVLDAGALLDAKRWSGAYYLAGYAAECALKACIAKQTNQYDFPEKNFANNVFTHSLERLRDLAQLEPQFNHDTSLLTDGDLPHEDRVALDENWRITKDWSEQARYQQKTEAQARDLYKAVTDPANGVLPWIKARW